MKVMFIPCWYPDPGRSNTSVSGTFVREHAFAAAIDNDVTVLHFVNQGRGLPGMHIDKYRDGPLTTYIVRIKDCGIPCTNAPFLTAWRLQAIQKVVKEHGKPDLINAQDTSSFYVRHLASVIGVPYVVSQHWSIFMRGKVPTALVKQFRCAFSAARAIMPVFQTSGSEYEHYGISTKVVSVPNCFDPSIFYPASEKREKWLLHSSGFTPEKRVDDIINAFSLISGEIPEARLHITGDGLDRSRLEEMANAVLSPETIKFHGFLGKRELSDLMRTCCGFVFPSEYETFGCVLMEAMACGCPVITTNAGGIPEVARDGECIRVGIGDVDAIARGMKALLLSDHGLDTIMIADNVRNRYSRTVIGSLLSKVYLNVLEKKDPSLVKGS